MQKHHCRNIKYIKYIISISLQTGLGGGRDVTHVHSSVYAYVVKYIQGCVCCAILYKVGKKRQTAESSRVAEWTGAGTGESMVMVQISLALWNFFFFLAFKNFSQVFRSASCRCRSEFDPPHQ